MVESPPSKAAIPADKSALMTRRAGSGSRRQMTSASTSRKNCRNSSTRIWPISSTCPSSSPTRDASSDGNDGLNRIGRQTTTSICHPVLKDQPDGFPKTFLRARDRLALAVCTWNLGANRPVAALRSFFGDRGELTLHTRNDAGLEWRVNRCGTDLLVQRRSSPNDDAARSGASSRRVFGIDDHHNLRWCDRPGSCLNMESTEAGPS